MELWDYQKEAVEFVRQNKKVYVALDMGMGKTVTALAAGAELAKKNILVIAEKNEIVNSQNFKREAELLGLTYTSLRDEEVPNEDARNGLPLVCGINPDALVKHELDDIVEAFDFVIVDEATMAKTTTTTRFKRVRKVCQEMEYVVLLSGTPMMNGAAELFAPLLLLGHRLVGDGTKVAREAFETIFAGGHRRQIRNTGVWWQDYVWWAKGANNVRELRHLIADRFFFRRKDESSIFKKKVRSIERVPMSLPWLAEYQAAWEEYLVKAEKREVNMENVLELQKLIENGQLYQVNSKWKVRRVAQDISAGLYGNQRIIVFTMFVESFELLTAELTMRNIEYRTFDDVNEWKKGDEQVLIGRIKAHGKGGNVPEASVALFVDMDFVPANNIQAENRIDRPEQTRDMTVVYYMAEGEDVIDEHVRKINQDKTQKIENFMRPLTRAESEEMPAKVEELIAKYQKPFAKLGLTV